MPESAAPADALRDVQFQLSLLQFTSLGAETPQAEALESLLSSQPRPTPASEQ